jgi:N-acyl-D-aspartate/D-glutamate deacylase
VGIAYVIVNGVVVINKGEHTGAKPGKVLYGRGKQGQVEAEVHRMRLLDPLGR